MKRFDYTHYQELLDSFDYKLESFNPHTEIFEQYIEILDKFDPISNPPEVKDKKEYIINFILPILQEYCRDWKAILELDEKKESITFNIITDKIKLEIYFSTR